MNTLLVLGGSSDIAKAIAHRYAKAGWNIVLAGRNPKLLSEDARDIEIRFRVQGRAVGFDVLKPSAHGKFYATLSPQPDGVVCAVGTMGDQGLSQADFAEAERIIDTNFVGCVSILNLIANDFETRKRGFIIGISSVAGERGRGSNYTYGSAKAAFTAYLSGLRNRLARAGVQVLTVKPGFVHTKMTERLMLPAMLSTHPTYVGKEIYDAQQRGADVLYTKWFWRWIMLAIRLVPERIFKKLSL